MVLLSITVHTDKTLEGRVYDLRGGAKPNWQQPRPLTAAVLRAHAQHVGCEGWNDGAAIRLVDDAFPHHHQLGVR